MNATMRVTPALLLVAALLALSGCTAANRQAPQASQTPSTVPSAEASAADPGTGTPAAAGGVAASGSGSGRVDVHALDAQLEAMQKEIDSLSMPTDNDFNGAASAVY